MRSATQKDATPHETDAAAYVDTAMRGRLDDLHNLQRLANPGVDLDEWSNDEILSLDIGYGVAGPLSREYIQEQAEERLAEYPLAVETMTTFEIVLGTGGPDDRLLIEARPYGVSFREQGGEIRRVLYRYSWEGSAEVELTGEDREVAEAFARQVVPELAE